MRISVVVITESKKIVDDVAIKKAGLIPTESKKRDFYKNTNSNFTLTSIFAKRDVTSETEKYLNSVRVISDSVILICQLSLAHVVTRYETVFFMEKFEVTGNEFNTQNLLGKPISKALKDFAFYATKFEDMKYRKIFLLPHRNFVAPDLDELCHLFSLAANRDVFSTQLYALLGQIRKRQTPKRPKVSNVEYLKDDTDRFYSYGHEEHAQPDSAIPPHNLICHLAHAFRFGRLYDGRRHFNVSVAGENSRISGDFEDCHGDQVTISARTHINMFANNFSCS